MYKCPELVSLSAVHWDFPLVGRTRMLSEQWSQMGQTQHFVQFPSYGNLIRGLRPKSLPSFAVQPWPSLPPVLWPYIPSRPFESSFRWAAKQLYRQLSRQVKIEESVALVVSPAWTPWLKALPFAHVIYDCIDDVSVMTLRPELQLLFEAWERDLIHQADAVVTSADTLSARILELRPDIPTTTIRNGCPADDFAKAAASAARPTDLPHHDHRPIVGFVGALYDWIDWELIDRVTEKRPEVDFVFVGPIQGQIRQTLLERENTFFLGAREYREVPGYLAHFDLCWLPFQKNQVSQSANPIKIYEYLSVGKPVVSTPVADMESYERQVDFGQGAENIAELIRIGLIKALAPATEREKTERNRKAFAQRQDWRTRAADYIDFVSTRFGIRGT